MKSNGTKFRTIYVSTIMIVIGLLVMQSSMYAVDGDANEVYAKKYGNSFDAAASLANSCPGDSSNCIANNIQTDGKNNVPNILTGGAPGPQGPKGDTGDTGPQGPENQIFGTCTLNLPAIPAGGGESITCQAPNGAEDGDRIVATINSNIFTLLPAPVLMAANVAGDPGDPVLITFQFINNNEQTSGTGQVTISFIIFREE